MQLLKKLQTWVWQHGELGFILALLGAAAFFHGWNMFHFPFFENDEGTYLAQAWSFLTQGKLAPYTYWYDHAPFGWIFTAAWVALTGGLFTFGFALNSGRVFMLLIHLLNVLLLYAVTKKISRSKIAAFVAVTLFSVSPLAVYFQRRLLLDNLMVFWVLLSFWLVMTAKSRLRRVFVSAITFGLACLTKENAVFFLPTMVWLVASHAHPKHRTIAIIKWLCLAGAVISFYPLYALLKGELFPPGSPFSPPHPHVSLLGTLAMQAGRGSGLPVWHQFSDFRVNLTYWMKEDWWLIVAGYSAFFAHVMLAIKSKKSRQVLMLTWPQVLFLASGKLVINFYVIALIPFLSLCIGVLVSHFSQLLQKLHWILGVPVALAAVAVMSYYYRPLVTTYLTKDETTAQLQAVDWIKKNVPSDSHMAIDFYAYLDLTYRQADGQSTFQNADWFWKVELDPDITEKKLGNDFRNVDYVMITAEVQRQISYRGQESLIKQALRNSQRVAEFSLDPTFPANFQLQKQTMPNGDWVVMYQQQRIDLQPSWETYKRKFLNPKGYIQPPEQSDSVISEAQSYALLRAVWMNDRETFDQVYAWTDKHMRLKKSHLFGWKYLHKSQRLIDEGNAPDADQDIALALLFAAKRWNEPRYYEDAQQIIKDIWEYNVYSDQRFSFVTAGNWADSADYVTLNPSYLAPYAYRIFAVVDQDHDWSSVLDSSYAVLKSCSATLLDKNYSSSLPPEWCRYEKNLGSFVASAKPQPDDSNYGYNAFRIPWKIYLDYQWNQDYRAADYLKSLDFLVWQHTQGGVVDVYSHDAVPQTKSQRYAYIMNLPVFLITDPERAQVILKEKFLPTYTTTQDGAAYWYEGDEYYLQNWAWFATAIYQGDLQNLYR